LSPVLLLWVQYGWSSDRPLTHQLSFPPIIVQNVVDWIYVITMSYFHYKFDTPNIQTKQTSIVR
jgi:hypothetical protein